MQPPFLPSVIIALMILAEGPSGRTERISYKTVKSWAHKLGFELSQLGKYVTQAQKLEASYAQAEVKPRDGTALVQEIAKDIGFLMESKISAVKRIMDVAESLAENASNNVKTPVKYHNAKDNNLTMTHSAHFGREVNLNYSNFHIPTNVYNQSYNVVTAITWAQKLNTTFMNNYDLDPSLSWQYFGSSTGFMMQYPAIEWEMDQVDLFDCRTRNWYIEAATSPKDILILVDNSGSMTGIRKEIARHVVNSILDTLGNNDFVNVITFSNETHEAVECFNNTLVQANLANIRELKTAMECVDTDKIANFTIVLTQAFELLQNFREQRRGTMCNQAIMLVTDGVPMNYKDIFAKYNWRANSDNPDMGDMPVRVFTYLIGREVPDVRDVRWMACANRGYYVHLSTMAEVSEKVLNYIPVMARPLVLGLKDHPVIWTPVYADETDPIMTDWLWELQERKYQRELVETHRVKDLEARQRLMNLREERERRFLQKHKRKYDQDDNIHKYRLMTSVSVPVFNRRPNANITEQVLVNGAYWVTKTRETRIAELLGVAGIDVPIKEIEKLMLPHMLGVNGYAFIVTNNGYILIHPDLRPFFRQILKPAYNSVDMVEVELMDDGTESRNFSIPLRQFRDAVINQSNGTTTLYTKYHYDDMQRVGRMKRDYFYQGINNTPFTVVVSLPVHGHGGSYRVHAIEEIHRYQHQRDKDATSYFSGSNWRVHPNWTYCGYHYDGDHTFQTPEEELLHFLKRTRVPGWKWMDMNRVGSHPPEHSHSGSSRVNTSKVERTSYYCDRNLLLSLVFDAMVTDWFANTNTTRGEKGKEFQQRFGFTLAFMATHSGLTRWLDFPIENDTQPEHHFGKLHPRAIEEVWYKRAVEQYYVQPDSFVFSVPIDDAGADNETLVTASHAIFIGVGKVKAPAAVVGFQFKHSKLQSLFRNITYSCEGLGNCQRSCEDEGLQCYLVDNNGYVVAGENASEAGKFFGEINKHVMQSLVDNGIYDEIAIYDYQAVCFRDEKSLCNHGNILLTPWKALERAAKWVLGSLAWMWVKSGIWSSADYAYAYPYPSDDEDEPVDEETEDEDEEDDGIVVEEVKEKLDVVEEKANAAKPRETDDQDQDDGDLGVETKNEKDQPPQIRRTRPETCDEEMKLYLLQNVSADKYDVDCVSVDDIDRDCERPYVVQPVDSSNMILLVVNAICLKSDTEKLTVFPSEIKYNDSLACYKAANSLPRRRPASCIRNHTREREIKDLCGGASRGISITLLSMLLPILLTVPSSIFAFF
ncbi:voltage-dependent calcium channel subunit alpha-2/delta-3 isoform X2 [Diprion similis]|uniref:voltage-dependent calcium channel subunit alpha-2/delta-3 isoform X2 n=1 Tax=Diprion similis TaxID=362088 RepID=UPI001EF962B9|nr:voltage-dependent calcium channel subunit alpha-2/delta-3 isoform X2 [Diprion similis]